MSCCFPTAASAGLLCAATASLVAQSPITTLPGFAAATAYYSTNQASLVRGSAFDPVGGAFYVALRNVLYQRPDPSSWNPVLTLGAGDELAAVRFDPPRHRVCCTSLRTGMVYAFDTATQTLTSFAGVANAFALQLHPGGAVVVSANPAWPLPGANTGLWLVAPAGPARQFLQLSGPSGPLAFDAAGGLLVADLGPVVPPPPGAVQLLHFPAARVNAALYQGQALVRTDADRVQSGWNGAYDLAFDDADRVYVTDPNSNLVRRAALATLVAETTPAAVLNGTGLQLQFLPQYSPSTPGFHPFQPDAHSPSLLVAASDFILFYEVLRVHPERPALQVWPGTTFGRGTAAFTLDGASPNGLMFLAGSTVAAPEHLFGVYEGAAIWLSLSPMAPLATASAVLDATGSATIHLTHPGGFAATLQFQAIGLGPLGSGQHGSSQQLTIQLLP